MQNNSSSGGNTPHGSAASTYGTHAQKNSGDPRETEARVLLKAANMMQDLQKSWNPDDSERLDDVLKYNRQIWMLFFDTALENKEGDRPNDLRSNILNLANFVFKRSIDILSEPKSEKLDALITINRDIAAGLMSNAGMPERSTGMGTTSTSA